MLSAFVIQWPLVNKIWTERIDHNSSTYMLYFQTLQDMAALNQTHAAHGGLERKHPNHTGSKLSDGFYAKM
jgi:hypothetical protein